MVAIDFLTAHGVINHVVEPTSILVTRGSARRAKTDRLDAVGLLRVLACKDCRRSRCLPDRGRAVRGRGRREAAASREREFLVQERVRSEKSHRRVASATQGVRAGRPSLRSWDADMRALRTGDGRPLPDPSRRRAGTALRRRLSLTLEMIRELDAVREAGSGSPTRLRKPNGQSALHDPRDRRELRLRPDEGGCSTGRSTTGGKSPAIWVLPQRLFERRHGSRSTHQSRRQQPSPQNARPTRLALASLPTREQPCGMVPGTVFGSLQGVTESAASQSSPWRASS